MLLDGKLTCTAQTHAGIRHAYQSSNVGEEQTLQAARYAKRTAWQAVSLIRAKRVRFILIALFIMTRPQSVIQGLSESLGLHSMGREFFPC